MKIMLLDDEESLLTALERELVKMGHAVEYTTDAEKAVGMIEKGNYDFALVDYMMPMHDGIWFMRNAQIPRKTKVLLMTASVNREMITTMLKLGARGYLIKPIDADEVNRHLRFHTDNRPVEPSYS